MKKLFSVILLFATIVVTAQEFNVSAEVRPRYEYRNGFKKPVNPAADAANFVSQRTRLNFGYKEDNYSVYFAIQNVRVWGDVATMSPSDKNGLTFHEAWGEYRFTPNIAVKLGRQEIVYDDHRIFGNVGWAQQARSHDALLVKFKTGENGKLHLGFALNENRETLVAEDYNINQYKAFQYAWYNTKFNDALGLSALFLNNGLEYHNVAGDRNVAYSQTIGARLTYKGGLLNADVASYLQEGRTPSGLPAGKTDLSAYYVTANVKFNVAEGFKIGAGIELLSGNDQGSTSTTDNAFKPFYGTNHKFNGWMDYFYVGSYMNSVGLVDINAPISFAKNKFSVALVPHFFSAAGTVLDTNTVDPNEADAYLGTEIDFTVGYKLHKSITVNVGYSQMFATDTMEIVKVKVKGGGDAGATNNWAWAMVTFKPNLFNWKKPVPVDAGM